MSLFLPDVDWAPPESLPELSGEIGLDFETRDPNLTRLGPGWFPGGDGEVVGVSVAWDDGRSAAYLPIAHAGGGNLDRDLVLRWLRAQLAKPEVLPVVANAYYELGWLRRLDIPVTSPVEDVLGWATLLDEYRRSYSLDSVARDYVGRGKDERLLREAARAAGVDPKTDMWRLPAPYVGAYAETDAVLSIRTWLAMKPKLDGEHLWEAHDLERDLIPLLVEMRWRGVRVDVQAAEVAAAEFRRRHDAEVGEVRRITGVAVDVWAARSMAAAFDVRGVQYARTRTGLPSFTREWLAACEDPVAGHLLAARRFERAASYVRSSVLAHVVQGRIHCQFHALRSDDGGAVTYRMSSSSPNLQQVPARDEEIGPACRSLFLPNEDGQWARLDYSQQEPRMSLHFAVRAGLPGAEDAARRYREDPTTDCHAMMARLTGLPRRDAKGVYLGLSYGMGGAKLCRTLGYPTRTVTTAEGEEREVAGEEGQAVLNRYDAGAPWVRRLSYTARDRAKERGYVVLVDGRRCRFREEWQSKDAMNRLIQGSSAVQMKRAIVAAHRKIGAVPLVVVHDEVGLSVGRVDDARATARIMEDAVPLAVPSVVGVEIGPDWGRCEAA